LNDTNTELANKNTDLNNANTNLTTEIEGIERDIENLRTKKINLANEKTEKETLRDTLNEEFQKYQNTGFQIYLEDDEIKYITGYNNLANERDSLS
jgi:chromosome segregation ATPase